VSVADRSFATIVLLAYSIVERTFTKFRVEALRKYPFLSGVHTRVLAAEQPYPRLHDKRHELRYFMQVREGWRASTPIFGTYHSVSASRASEIIFIVSQTASASPQISMCTGIVAQSPLSTNELDLAIQSTSRVKTQDNVRIDMVSTSPMRFGVIHFYQPAAPCT
jgi:hypothetical protein